MNYKNLFDSESKLMRGKQKDGKFAPEFSPLNGEVTLRKETAGIIPGLYSMTLRD